MPRGPRLDAPGVLHHVMIRGIERRPIFREESDREDFVRRLADLVESGALIVYAWALLPNHAHLLIRTVSRPIAKSMRSLLTGYAGSFNRRHRRVGHLFQNRYKSIVVEEEEYLLELVRYLHLNPLRTGIVRDLRELQRYPWTGHAALCGLTPRPWQATADILERFARTPRRAREIYCAFVAAGVAQGRRPDLQGGGLVRSVGGWQAVRALRRGREAHMADERVLGSGDFVERLLRELEQQGKVSTHSGRRRPDLDTLLGRVGQSVGVTAEILRGRNRNRKASLARQLLAYAWIERLGRTGSDLTRLWGWSRGHASWVAKRGAAIAERWNNDIEKWCA